MPADAILDHLRHIRVLPRRLSLCTPGVEPTVPMLRGAWGAALHRIDSAAYAKVFGPEDGELPLYLMRAGPPIPRESPCIEHILLNGAIECDLSLLKAWMQACDAGLGPRRDPFFIRGYTLDAMGVRSETDSPWPLSDARYPVPGEPDLVPVTLRFPLPLRILRAGKLVAAPALPDIVASIARRVGSLLHPSFHDSWRQVSRDCLEAARGILTEEWIGGPLDAWRWSARQQAEVQLRGVAGSLELPDGPGPLWPLLAAASWIHLGKGTVFGMGQLFIEAA